ncbi:MAG: hypothetical protein WCV99_13580 [Sterolibacterium sp.]|jgi:hypothetical protein
MFTQQMKNDYLKEMFSLARQCEVLVPAQRRYFMRQLSLLDHDHQSGSEVSDQPGNSTRSVK